MGRERETGDSDALARTDLERPGETGGPWIISTLAMD